MEKAKNTNIENVLITGDFNDNIRNSKNCKISGFIKDIGMTQLISNSTHFTENSETILNLLIVNDTEKIDFFGMGENVLPSTTLYHCLVYCVLKLPKSYTRTFTRKIWSFAETNFSDYKTSLQNQDWDSIIWDDKNQVCNEITNKILYSASENIPNIEIR